MTDKPSDDNDFSLNNFDPEDETPTEKRPESEPDFTKTETFYTADLFADAGSEKETAPKEKEEPFDTTWGAERFAGLGYGKKEPEIRDEPGTDEAGESEHEEPMEEQMEEPIVPPGAPPISSEMPASSPPSPEDGEKRNMTTAFVIAAILIAGIAALMNLGDDADEENGSYSSKTVLGSDVQLQRMERRISALEEEQSQQEKAIRQQIDNLEEQVAALTSLITEQAKEQKAARSVKKQTVRSQPAKPAPSTAPVTTKPKGGWVINLVSVDSEYAANKALASYRAKGIPAEISRSTVKGKRWYRIRVAGFASQKEASAQKAQLSRKYGIKDAWVHKPK